MKINQKVAILLILITSISFISTPVSAADQPFMKAALADLHKAQAFLKRGAKDKAGHQKKALNLVVKAISAVNDGIDYDNKNSNESLRPASEFDQNILSRPASASSDRSDLVAAKEQLEIALNNLDRAMPDKGGFRLKAMNFVREAIVLVNGGLRDPSV
jgi:hypothetical protein